MKIIKGTVLNKNFKFEKADISIDENGIILYNSADTVGEVLNCDGCYIIPGLIDIHTHGAMNYDHLDALPEGEKTISEYMLNHGTTSYLGAVMTESHDTMLSALQNIKDCRSSATGGARLLGVYLEGPYFSQEFRGAQNPKYIRKASADEFDEFQIASGNCIKAVSVAPETDGAQNFIKQYSDKVSVAIGHTAADYDTAMTAVNNGAKIFTHTFNGMSGLHHRNPNTVGAAMDSDAYCECICDGIHIHPAIIRTLYKVKGKDKMILISDSIRPAGLPDGEYSSGGQAVNVKDGKAYLNNDTLAGSTTFVLQCVRNAVKFGIPLNDAVKMASYNPAKAIGVSDHFGSIANGKVADLLVLDKNLELIHVILGGKIIF